MFPGHVGMVLGKSKLKHSLHLQEHHSTMGNNRICTKSLNVCLFRAGNPVAADSDKVEVHCLHCFSLHQ